MPLLVNYQQKLDEAIEAYFTCKDKEQKDIIAFFLGIELQNLKATESMLDKIINADTRTLRAEYKRRHNALIKEMVKYLSEESHST